MASLVSSQTVKSESGQLINHGDNVQDGAMLTAIFRTALELLKVVLDPMLPLCQRHYWAATNLPWPRMTMAGKQKYVITFEWLAGLEQFGTLLMIFNWLGQTYCLAL